jgi:hypothetical protein
MERQYADLIFKYYNNEQEINQLEDIYSISCVYVIIN